MRCCGRSRLRLRSSFRRALPIAAELAAAYAHPAWMVERWALRYGMEKAAAICRFDQEQPATCVRLVSETAEADLVAEGIELAPGAFLAKARRVVRGDVTATVTYRNGGVRIQDEGSQLVAELAGKGENILDCCAAPGGKTAILAERNPKSALLACDVSRRRLDEMRGLLRKFAVRGFPMRAAMRRSCLMTRSSI